MCVQIGYELAVGGFIQHFIHITNDLTSTLLPTNSHTHTHTHRYHTVHNKINVSVLTRLLGYKQSHASNSVKSIGQLSDSFFPAYKVSHASSTVASSEQLNTTKHFSSQNIFYPTSVQSVRKETRQRHTRNKNSM